MKRFYSKFVIIFSLLLIFNFTYNYNLIYATGEIKEIKNDNTSLSSGWVIKDGNWKFLENGQAKIGWIEYNNKWYFCDQDGFMKTGWHLDNGKWYYLESDGAMKTGWFISSDSCYYLEPSGAMKTGWLFDNDNWYFFHGDGKMFKGWHLEDGSWHYLKEDGTMARGWTSVNEAWYHMNASGKMATSWEKVGEFCYYFGKDGKWNRDKLMDDRPGYLTDTKGRSVKYEKIISGSCTAYTAPKGAITSVGLAPKVGYVAVDPKVIPYGTKMYISSPDGSIVYGYAIAADTGGAMLSGRRLLDLYYDTERECILFGVQRMNAYILSE